MYLLNNFNIFSNKNKKNLLPNIGSKLGGIGYGTKRGIQGAIGGFKKGLELGKKEFKRSGNTKIKNPAKVSAIAGLKLGASAGKAVGTIEGKIKGYKKGKELQNKLPKFNFLLLDEFKTKDNGKTLAKSVATGAGVAGAGLTGKHLVKRAVQLNNDKKGYKMASSLYEIAKKEQRDFHPDRVARKFDNPILQKGIEDSYKKRFQQAGINKEIAKKGMDTFEPLANRKYKDIIKQDIIDGANKVKSKLGSGLNVLKNNKGKTALVAGGLIAGATALKALRKSRKDKGKLRGKYNK